MTVTTAEKKPRNFQAHFHADSSVFYWVSFLYLPHQDVRAVSQHLPLGLFTEDIFGVRQRLALCFFTTPGSAQGKSIERRLLNGLFSKLQPRDAQPSTNTHFDLSTHSCLGKFTSAVHPL